jgi:hypothetical protein
MDKLSERLDAEIAILQKQAAEVRPKSIRHWELSQSIALLTEAAKLARRVEEADAGVVEYNFGCCLSVRAESGQWLPIQGQRVRLVRED